MKTKYLLFGVFILSIISNFFVYYYKQIQIDSLEEKTKKLTKKIDEYDKIINNL